MATEIALPFALPHCATPRWAPFSTGILTRRLLAAGISMNLYRARPPISSTYRATNNLLPPGVAWDGRPVKVRA